MPQYGGCYTMDKTESIVTANREKNENGGFYTDSGYAKQNAGMTPAAEDYLEMICRLSAKGPVRIKELSECLHVSPSSASRMAQQMSASGYVDFKRYGYITLTEAGAKTGDYLMKRHKIVKKFLELLKDSADELKETERIEHYLSEETVAAMEHCIAQREEIP